MMLLKRKPYLKSVVGFMTRHADYHIISNSFFFYTLCLEEEKGSDTKADPTAHIIADIMNKSAVI